MKYLFNKKFFKSIKTIAFLSLFFSLQFFSQKASATAIASTLSWSTISPTATGTCVSGYYSTGWDGSSAYWLYTLSTCGYSNITMAANNTSSNTGPTGGDIYYSINGGTSYIYYGSYSLSPCTGCCTITTITATFPTSCNNLATFLVKIIPYSCAGTGTNRIVSDGGFAGTPSGISTVSISSTSPAAGTIAPSSTNNLLQTFNMTVGTSATTLTDITVNTLGTYVPTTDITNLKCWYSTSSTFSTGSATLLSTITPGASGSSNTFSSLAQTLPVGASYIYITADVAAGATSGHTISLASIPSVASNFTFSTTCLTLSGSATASNTQTIASPTTPPSITSSPANQTICSGTSTSFTATATGMPTPTYQWQRSTTGTGGPWVNITTGMDGGIYGASFTTNTLTLTGATLVENGYAYQMIATNAYGTATSTPALLTVISVPTVAAITGTTLVCAGSTTPLTDATAGGTWSSVSTGVATVNTTGVVTGVAAGTSVISYTITNACGTTAATTTVTVDPVAAAVIGTTTLCVGANSTLSTTTTGGTWSSSNPLIATIGSSTGIVTAIAQGTATITYTLINSCGTSTSTTTVTVNRTAAIILGTDSVCVGSTTTLTDSTTGGIWTSSNPGVASVIGGIVTGVSNGTATITYTVTNACGTSSHTITVTVNTAAGAITGTTTVCVGNSSTLSNPATGGTWSSSNPLIATIGSSTGIVTAIAQGTATITYTLINSCGTSTSTTTVTVNRTTAIILGTDSVCVGSTTTLTDSTTGGIWTSSNPTIATVAGGVVTGIARGIVTITYTVTNICGTTSQTVNVTVNTIAASISGTSNLCFGSTVTLTDSVSGGTWTSVNPAIASVISTSGVVTGVSQGTTAIAYSVINACGSSTVSITINVSRPAAPVNGLDTVCTGSTIVLTDSTTGGTWSSSNAYATVSGIGIVTGVATGLDIITYTVTNICGTTYATKSVYVLAPPSAGTITGSNTVCSGYSIALASTVSGGTWTRSNISASISGSCLVTGFLAGIDTISYSVTNSCGTTVANTTITVNTTVIPTVSIAAYPNLFLCPGVRAIYTAVTTSGGSAPTYSWTVNGTVVSTNDTFSNYPGNGDIVRCAIISNATCALPDTASNAVTVSVSPPAIPTVDFVSSGGDTTCLGVNNTFTASVTHGGSTPLIQWSVNWALVGTGSTFSYVPANGDIVTCKLTSSSGCVFPDTAAKTMVITVKPFETPLVNLNLNPGDSVCEGSPITLTVNPIYPGYTPSFYWYKNGSLAGFGTSYTYQPAEGDSMSCVMISSYHCPIPSDTAKQGIKLHLVPVLHVMVDGRALIMQNQIDTFYVVTTNAGPAPTYQWLINSTPIWGATSTRFATPYITNFDSVSCVVTTHGNACEGVASFNWIIMEVGPLDVNLVNSGKSAIQLIPNPNKGEFVITGKIISGAKEVELQITDVVGQVVYSDAAMITAGELKKNIYLNSNLANGIYLLHIKSANENNVISFSVNR